ncbi:hypothetical protein VM1G_12081 [Cytospora mali]|uniref:Uncharacterized protein n=1 Tax=Cytospora mali TaxID=578113 RepID=A0A194VK55_CYTMA|nr:hypothetical protein VM1G_12081 [Valsa mali]
MSQTRAILGPLTTIFEQAPDWCDKPVIYGRESGTLYGNLAQPCANFENELPYDPSCWPPTTSGVATTEAQMNRAAFYSPGLYCPSGLVTACVSTEGVEGNYSFRFPLESGETAAGCCPVNYQCPTDHGMCSSHASKASFLAVDCDSDGSITVVDTYHVVIPTTVSGRSTVISAVELQAPMIQLVWRSDPPATTAASSTVPPVLPSYNPAPPSPGLSTGAKAGIGVASCSVVLSVIGFACCFLLGNRRRMRDRLVTPAAPTGEASPFELPDPRSNRYELESPGSLQALAGPKTPSELPLENLNVYNHDDRSRAGELVELE